MSVSYWSFRYQVMARRPNGELIVSAIQAIQPPNCEGDILGVQGLNAPETRSKGCLCLGLLRLEPILRSPAPDSPRQIPDKSLEPLRTIYKSAGPSRI